MHPQAFGYWWRKDGAGKIISTCALGAASCAVDSDGEHFMPDSRRDLMSILGWIEDPYVEYPHDTPRWKFDSDDPRHMNIFSAIGSLNDDARWTREQIAEWLQSIGF